MDLISSLITSMKSRLQQERISNPSQYSSIQSNSPSKTPHIHPINLLRPIPTQIGIDFQMLSHTLIGMIQQPAIRMMHHRHSADSILAVGHDTRQGANAAQDVFCDTTTGITKNA
jgi:hypothetical protein